jgi:hypothetical protein
VTHGGIGVEFTFHLVLLRGGQRRTFAEEKFHLLSGPGQSASFFGQ